MDSSESHAFIVNMVAVDLQDNRQAAKLADVDITNCSQGQTNQPRLEFRNFRLMGYAIFRHHVGMDVRQEFG